MKKITLGARILLGLIFFVFGLNGFFQFLPMPPLPEAAGKLMGAFAEAGYMFPMIKGVEVLAGALLLSGFFVPLALILLSPIVVNILLFHLVLTPGEAAMSIVLVVLQILAAVGVWDKFKGVLSAK